ncbi:zinc-ribbon domain-containing protein [Sphingomicrobium aestuariivivum]|uniref:zinc-ribbon domain-containing protein n=1 Tax=Sphingomicrobium aestuariivivum TaxID=1582356 RepID=UPI001FD6E07C|nr:zinc-ribbon domain-containing protein [Sphingomicrobium aestuariivivum]MCJ8191179.1 zinc-ribbon domain-containing protein [Sphingomicrobium aestuariivivum]
MILTCPACATRYNVKAGAIPPEGRTVRCANCGHKWHAEPEEAPADAVPAPEPVASPPPPPPVTEPETAAPVETPPVPEESEVAPPPPVPEPEPVLHDEPVEPEVRAEAEEQAAHQEEAIAEQHVGDPFDHEPEIHDIGFTGIEDADEPEAKNRRWIWLFLLVALLAALVAAAAVFAPPQWKDQLGLTAAAPASETPLDLILTSQSREKLESGNDFLSFGGRVVNSSTEQQDVPPIRVELVDEAGAVVASWTIPPPAEQLDPGESASFNSAEADIPPSARDLVVTFAK